jgi:CRP-like cAMP-binding protein
MSVVTSGPDAYRQNRVLASLADVEMERLDGHAHTITLDAGTILYQPHAPIRHVHFPLDCSVTLVSDCGDGQKIDVAVIGADGMVEPGIVAGMTTAPTEAVVQVGGEALVVDREAVVELLEESAVFREAVGEVQTALLTQSLQISACNAVHSVEARMCRWLLQIRDCIGQDMLPVTQQALAQMVGVQRTTITLVEQNLKNARIVRQRRGRIEVLDLAALEGRACACYGHIKYNVRRPLREAEQPRNGVIRPMTCVPAAT